MTRRNLYVILATMAVSFVCYRSWDPYAQYFSEVKRQIELHYPEPIKPRELYEFAVRGMIGRLDRHSAYWNRSEVQHQMESLDQQFVGIGAEVSVDPQTKEITARPLFDSPAAKAGMLPGDKILAINGQSTAGIDLENAIKQIKGRIGEPVDLTISRNGSNEPVELRLERDVIHVDSVKGDVRGDDGYSWNFALLDDPRIGYLRVDEFGEHTGEEVDDALQWLKEHSAQGLVLDLRNNGGGILPIAVHICDQFLNEGVIVTIRGRDYEVEHDAHPGTACDLPMVVLINGDSASASEIVAACLQDHKCAAIVGERSYGKGSVQNLIPIEGGKSRLKLTTAKYWPPSGRNIHRETLPNGDPAPESDVWGVKPDAGLEVPLSPKEVEALVKFRRQRELARVLKSDKVPEGTLLEHDPQLNKAVEYLREKIGH